MSTPATAATRPLRKSGGNAGRRKLLLLILLTGLAAAAVAVNINYAQTAPFRAHLSQGSVYLNAHRPADAEREWREALKLDPARFEPYILLSRLYIETERAKEAIPLLEQLKKMAPQTPHTLCSLAEAYTRVNRNREGKETAQQAVILEPNCASAHAILGIHFGEQGDTKGAISELSKATSLAPNDDQILLSYGQAQLDAGDLTGAEASARKAVARKPDYDTAWYTLGRSYARRTPTPENMKEAIAAFRKVIELNPNIPAARSELGRLLVLANQNQEAIQVLEDNWRRGGQDEDTAFNLSAAYRKTGDQNRSAKFGTIFKHLNELNSKKDALEKRLTINPGDAKVALDLAKTELELGQLQESRDLITSILKEQPLNRGALDAAAKLFRRIGDSQTANAYEARLQTLPH